MRLPGGHKAVVDIQKLVDYCLNVNHPRGKHKARVFAHRLGITAAHAEALRRALLEAAVVGRAIPVGRDEYGARYVVDFELHGTGGSTTVRSAWIIRRGEDFPRLASCYVK
jgi:hypothetical protein